MECAREREEIRALVGRIEVVEIDELNGLHRMACEGNPRGNYASRVVCELVDGQTVEASQMEGESSFPQETQDEQSLERKSRWLTAHVLDE